MSSGGIVGAAAEFVVGDTVIVMREINQTGDERIYKVLSLVSGKRTCVPAVLSGDCYILYLDGTTYKIKHGTFAGGGITVDDTQTAADIDVINSDSSPVTFFAKRFTHNVTSGGVTTARDLYFIATSLYINDAPFAGWTAFRSANPTHALVTNTQSAQITLTSQVTSDLNTKNAYVNTHNNYVPDPLGNDNWHIMTQNNENGDCEDFALTKAQKLLDLGYAASAMHIECGYIRSLDQWHAWLVVQTTGGDYALDTSSNSIILNKNLTYGVGQEPYRCRMRQIGPRWAAISPFAWLAASSNQTQPTPPPWYGQVYCWYYILDPLLNILYRVPTPDIWGGLTYYRLPFTTFERQVNPGDFYRWLRMSWSVNFSLDNNGIFIAVGTSYTSIADGFEIIVREYKLSNNELTLVSATGPQKISPESSVNAFGFVGRDGKLVPADPVKYYDDPVNVHHKVMLHSIDVISKPGYYDFKYHYRTEVRPGGERLDGIADTVPQTKWRRLPTYLLDVDDVRYLPITISRIFGNSFRWRGQDRFNYGDCYDDYYPISSVTRAFPIQQFITPFGETINDYGKDGMGCWPYYWNRDPTNSGDYYNHDPGSYCYYPRPWSNIDKDTALFIQSFMLKRAISQGDDIYRIYVNGTDYTSIVATAAGVTADKILGFIHIPNTERLNV